MAEEKIGLFQGFSRLEANFRKGPRKSNEDGFSRKSNGGGFSWESNGGCKKNNNNLIRLVSARIENGRGKNRAFLGILSSGGQLQKRAP